MLTLNNVSASYGDIQVLDRVNLMVNPREIAAIVGSNGAGKTTLINLITGFLRCTPGEIYFMGERIDILPPHEIVDRGIVQIPEGRLLFPKMTVTENLEMGAYIARARMNKQATLNRVMDLFPVIKDRRGQLAGSLSGGEQQMLAIARGLMANPTLLILDEPSLGLAPLVVEEMFKVILEINEQGITIVLVEQNVFHTLTIAHKAFVLENGRIVMEGIGRELLNHQDIKSAYLGI
jgi:branched-chain amino acid transport system ATP-binding protein